MRQVHLTTEESKFLCDLLGWNETIPRVLGHDLGGVQRTTAMMGRIRSKLFPDNEPSSRYGDEALLSLPEGF